VATGSIYRQPKVWNITKAWNTATSLIKEAARNIYNQKPGILLVKEIISNILALVLFQPAVDGQ